MHRLTQILILLAVTALAGCGQMGPLYQPLPEESASGRNSAQR